MKASDFILAYDDYKYFYLNSDINMGIRFGCDCGCGGDYYTQEKWDEMVNEALSAKDKFIKFCNKNNIEYDLE